MSSNDLTRVALTQEQCQALRGEAHRLSPEQLNRALQLLGDWQLIDGELVRECRFDDYYRSIAFVNALAFIAHAQDHHPDLSVHYNRVQVRFSTHDVGGISRNDLICAARVDQLLA